MEIKRKKDGSIEGITTWEILSSKNLLTRKKNVWRGKKSMMKNME